MGNNNKLICGECKGTGQYVGLDSVAPCSRGCAGGSGDPYRGVSVVAHDECCERPLRYHTINEYNDQYPTLHIVECRMCSNMALEHTLANAVSSWREKVYNDGPDDPAWRTISRPVAGNTTGVWVTEN